VKEAVKPLEVHVADDDVSFSVLISVNAVQD